MMNQMFWSGFFGKIVCVYNNIKMLDFYRMVIILSGKCDKTKQWFRFCSNSNMHGCSDVGVL